VHGKKIKFKDIVMKFKMIIFFILLSSFLTAYKPDQQQTATFTLKEQTFLVLHQNFHLQVEEQVLSKNINCHALHFIIK